MKYFLLCILLVSCNNTSTNNNKPTECHLECQSSSVLISAKAGSPSWASCPPGAKMETTPVPDGVLVTCICPNNVPSIPSTKSSE